MSAKKAKSVSQGPTLQLLPYPQEVKLQHGRLTMGHAMGILHRRSISETQKLAVDSLNQYLPEKHAMIVAVGSVEEGYDPKWLNAKENAFLKDPNTSDEAYILLIKPEGTIIVGKSKWGMLYGAQTLTQLIIQATREDRNYLPCLTVHDWPDARWRCLSPQIAWYAGWAFSEGYDMGTWGLDEWKWLVDWSLLHKFNAWALCMYGLWPFTLPKYEEETMDFGTFRYDPATGEKTPFRYVHPNIKKEFLPELIRYANARGIQMHAYIGKNSYNGAYIQHHPETNAQSLVAEAIPFAPGIQEYWDAFIRRILEIGFNGFVFEDPEMNHVPNQNEQCYKTFWAPWAKEYAFNSVADTSKNAPPLGVQVEYYTWLFREFDALIQKHAKAFGQPNPEIYLISHILLNRIMKESKSDEERAKWFALIDEKHGWEVPFVLIESDEVEYARFLGPERVATLGGRGGAGAAYTPTANINKNHLRGDVDSSVSEEQIKQRRMMEAGGYGGMAYIFQWTSAEVFGYIGAQYYWRHSGVPGVNPEDDFGFLDHAYRMYYGDKVGRLAAQAYSVNSCVNEWMVLDDSGDWAHGKGVGRDIRLLAVMADQADDLAFEAYERYTGANPDLYHSLYDSDNFRWDGYDTATDRLFKSERLRLLCVSTRRSKELCTAAMAFRKGQQLSAMGAPVGESYEQFDIAAKAARTNELLYFANYGEHYHTRGRKNSEVRERLEQTRDQFLNDCKSSDLHLDENLNGSVPEPVRSKIKQSFIAEWEKQTDILPGSNCADAPGLYLSVGLALGSPIDYFCVGTVFTVQAQDSVGTWKTLFRRALLKKDTEWQHWDIPLNDALLDHRVTHQPTESLPSLPLRLLTDSYSRAFERKPGPNAPKWKWGYWGRPQIVEIGDDGGRRILYDLVEHVEETRIFVKLDGTGEERPFDGKGQDSTGAEFRSKPEPESAAEESDAEQTIPSIAAFVPHLDGNSGLTIAEYDINLLKEKRKPRS